MLDREFKYFLDHQQELVAKYPGKFIVIQGEEVIGAFDSEIQAYRESQRTNKLGTFLIQKCEMGSEVYTQTFHSRAIFA
jgi:hypothetical protein